MTAGPGSAGAALALGAVAAAVAAFPAVHRVSQHQLHPGVVWLALAGGSALVLGPLLALARAVPQGSRGVRAALLGIALAVPPLAVFGERLKLQTHHRPLGAATYGVLALMLVLLAVLVAFRLLAYRDRDPTPFRRALFTAVTATALAGVGLTMLRALGAEGLRTDVLDALRLLSVGIVAYLALGQPRVEGLAKRAGGILWVMLVAAGLASSRGEVGESIRAHARVLSGPIVWL